MTSKMISGTFQIAQGEKMCRHRIENIAYKHYKRREDSENYFKTEELQETLEWKSVLGRTFKGGVVTIINPSRCRSGSLNANNRVTILR